MRRVNYGAAEEEEPRSFDFGGWEGFERCSEDLAIAKDCCGDGGGKIGSKEGARARHEL